MSAIDLVTSLLKSDEIPVVLAALTAIAVLGTVWMGLSLHDPTGARLKSLGKISKRMQDDLSATRRNRTREDFRQSGLGFMRQSVEKFNLMRGRQVEQITARLARAGWRSKDALTAYLFAKAVMPLVILGGGLLFILLRSQIRLSPLMTVLAIAPGGLAGLFGVDMLITRMGDARIKRLTLALPDALDLLVICAEAGLSLDTALKRVGEEMAANSIDMSDELLLTGLELNYLPDRQKALKNLASRTDMPKFRALTNSLVQSERFGTPLANTLRVLSAEFREERMMAAEEKAARLPAIMTMPMIMFILPSLFMIVLGPAIIHIIDTFKH